LGAPSTFEAYPDYRLGGGIIPEEDRPTLERLGVAAIFTPGATTQEIVDWIRAHIRPRTM
jgi:methylmalonyl-CoA mutase C-terminal domain/subunit